MPFIAARVGRDKLVRLIGVALVIWVVGQLFSDAVHGLGVRVSMQVVTGVTILGLFGVLLFLGQGDFRRTRCLAAGVAAGLALQTVLVDHASLTSATSWKFGLNGPVAVGLLAITDLAWRRGQRSPSVLALGALCVLGVVTDHRHLAAVAFLSAIVLLFRKGQRHPKTISVLAGLMLLIAVLSGAFIQAAESGVLGERSGGQIQQFGGSPQSVVVNVRPEPFQEFYLFTVQPLLGWSSQPRLDSRSYEGSKSFLRDLGVVREDLDSIWLPLEVPGVSAHSQAIDSWARAGLAAVPFWLLLLGLAMVAGTQAIRFRSSPLLVMWTILILWDAIFSPLTGLSHIEIGAYLAVALTSLGHGPRSGVSSD
jgi:hypothetical protein